MATIASRHLPRPQRRYVPVRAKFALALSAALVWLMMSIMLGQAWVDALGQQTHPLFALFAISFIAYIPGFMNAFLVACRLRGPRPRRPPLRGHPRLALQGSA